MYGYCKALDQNSRVCKIFWVQFAYIIQMSALKEVTANHTSLISDYKSGNASFRVHGVSGALSQM